MASLRNDLAVSTQKRRHDTQQHYTQYNNNKKSNIQCLCGE